MDDTANDDARAKLLALALEIISRLDREIEELRRLEPPGYESSIEVLKESMLTIHGAIDEAVSRTRR